MSLSSVLGALRINITADSAGFTDGVKKVQGGSKLMNTAMATVAASAVALGGSLVALGANAISAATELRNFSAVANAGFEEFQGWAAGAKTVGIEADKLSDILKDVNDKVGDFRQTGGGAMADFFEKVAPKVGITADAFKDLSGPQALQLYVSALERAGLSQADMVFYMEAIASDATALLPLLRNNGLEMKRLGDAAKASGAVMSQATADSLNRAKASIAEMRTAFAGVGQSIIAQVAPAVEQAASSIADFVKNSEGIRVVAATIGGTFSAAANTVAFSVNALSAVLDNVGTAISAVAILMSGRLVMAAYTAGAAVLSFAGSMTAASLASAAASLQFGAGMTAAFIGMRLGNPLMKAHIVLMKAQVAVAGALRFAYAAVGGPLGLFVAGLSLAAVGLVNAKRRADEMRQTVLDLNAALAEWYKTRAVQEATPTVDGAQAELDALLKTQQELVARKAQIEQTLASFPPVQNLTSGRQAEFATLTTELGRVNDLLLETQLRSHDLGRAIDGNAFGGAKVLTKEVLEQVKSLEDATAQKETQLRLDAIAQEHGADSLVYKQAAAAAVRDEELAKLKVIEAQVRGNAEGEAAVRQAREVARATYDAAVAAAQLNDKYVLQALALDEATAQQENQLRLDALAAQHGADSLIYKQAAAAAVRDEELARVNALAAHVAGNAAAEASVQRARDVAHATYEAAVANAELTDKYVVQALALKDSTAQKETQLRLDEIAAQYGAESVQYKLAQADATRDAEVAAYAALAAQVEGNAEASLAVQNAIDVANATYEAEAAGYAFANAMASVKEQVAGVINMLAQIGGGIMANAEKFTTAKLINEGKSRAEAEKQVRYAAEDRELEALKANNAALMPGVVASALNFGLDTVQKGNRNADEALEAAYALDAERQAAARESARKSGGGGGSKKASAGGGGGGRSASGSSRPSDAEREAERTADRQADAMRRLTEEHELYQNTVGMSEQAERIYRATQEAGAVGDEAKAGRIRQLIIETDALKRAQEELRAVVETVRGGFEDMFVGVITKSKSASDALKDMGAQLAKMAASSAFKTLLNGTPHGFGGIGGLVSGFFGMGGGGGGDALSAALGAAGAPVGGGGGGFLGSLFGGLIGANANGTPSWGGGLTWVGERGPELVDMSRGAKILSNPASKRLVEGGGGQSEVVIRLEKGLRGDIVKEANGNAVQIVQAGIGEYDTKQSSRTFGRNSADPRARG